MKIYERKSHIEHKSLDEVKQLTPPFFEYIDPKRNFNTELPAEGQRLAWNTHIILNYISFLNNHVVFSL